MPRMKTKQKIDVGTSIVEHVYVNDNNHNKWSQVKAGNSTTLIVEDVYDTDVITYDIKL